jgi:hypothetical protein
MAKTKFLPEKVKDAAYRYLGLFPPNPPTNPPLELTPEIKKKIEDLRTVCLFLGPNRNLTTLTASVLALHPNCQVMSHGGQRVFPDPELNFFNDYTHDKFIKFCHFVYVMSQTKDKGSFGGGITITHAFRYHEIMRNTYRRRYGRSLLKEDVQSLVWKEAHRTDDYVQQNKIDIGKLLTKNEKLRFLMPIRNPIHIASSYFNRKGFRNNFFKDQAENPEINVLLDRLLEKMKRAIALHKAYPDRVMVFFENDVDPDLFGRMAAFLQIEADEQWTRDALKCFEITPTQYEIPPSVSKYYQQRVNVLFAKDPATLDRFNQYLTEPN